MKIGIVGAGSWGTTFAIMLAKSNHEVSIWTQDQIDLKNMINYRINKKYFPEHKLPDNLQIVGDLEGLCTGKELIVLAVPSFAIRNLAKKIKPFIEGVTILNLAKGLEDQTGKTMSQVVNDELEGIKYVSLSGPNIAKEIIDGLPAASVISGNEKEVLEFLQNEISNKYFKIYINYDLIGVEIAGAVKNIIAIASGFIKGRGLGVNTRAQLVSRGMAEMVRFGMFFGGQERTFFGLSGLGDLITTSFSNSSRNFTFGFKVGSGMSVKEALESTHMVIEGVKTCRTVYLIAKKFNIDMPITTEIYKGIYENKHPDELLESLLMRSLKEE